MEPFAYSNKILCFGELLLRLSPTAHERIEQSANLQVYYEGAEAMVAIDLAHQGENVAYASCISDNRIADRGLMNLLSAGVDVTRVTRHPGRMGIIYFERGAGERRSAVIYDREHTPMTYLSCKDFDWDRMLNGIDSFYFSGIVPAISEELRRACEDALIACKGRGVKTYCDLNYRPRMWNRAVAHDTWERLLPYVDVLIASDEDIWSIFPVRESTPTGPRRSGTSTTTPTSHSNSPRRSDASPSPSRFAPSHQAASAAGGACSSTTGNPPSPSPTKS